MKNAERMRNMIKVLEPGTQDPERAMDEAREIKAAFDEHIKGHVYIGDILVVRFKDGSFFSISENTSFCADDFEEFLYVLMSLPKEYERKFAALKEETLRTVYWLEAERKKKDADNH